MQRGRPLCFSLATAWVLLSLCAPAISPEAAEIELRSRTYLYLFEDAEGKDHAPLIEYLDLTLNDLAGQRYSFHAAGWLRYDLKARITPERELDELSYAFLQYIPRDDRSLVLRFGRHRMAETSGMTLMDGVSGRWEITQRSGLSLFAGIPVETESDGRRADLLYGGRVFQRIERKAEIGLSFLREDNGGSRFREELGLDLWFLPVKKAEISGRSVYNTATGGWMEHDYLFRTFPSDRLAVAAWFARVDYRDAFIAATMSAFSPEFLGVDEGLTRTGGSAEYRFENDVSATLDFTAYTYRKSGKAVYFGGRVSVKAAGASIGASAHRMEGETGRLRYTELRAYGKRGFGMAQASADLVLIRFDEPYNSLKSAYSLTGAVGYPLSRTLSAVLAAEFRKTPDFDRETRLLLRLSYALAMKRRT